MPGTNRDALYQLVATVVAPLLLVVGVVSLYLVWALLEASLLGPALLVLGAAVAATLVAVKLQAIAAGTATSAVGAAVAEPPAALDGATGTLPRTPAVTPTSNFAVPTSLTSV